MNISPIEITTIVGARPQFIKASVVSRALINSNQFMETVIHTGQHYDLNLSRIFFEELDLPEPEYNLAVGSGSHGFQTARMLEGIEAILFNIRPKMVLVYGDTNSTLAGALAASKLNIPIAHVEAGLRSFNRRMPEEVNRVLTDHCSSQLFAPTKTAVSNLINEGIKQDNVHLVGDVMYDAAKIFADKAEKKSQIINSIGLTKGNFILATVHRAENTDNPEKLKAICEGLSDAAKHIPVIMPLHPRTKEKLKKLNLYEPMTHEVKILDPLGYLDMVMLEKNAAIIVTDSGGIQKEAYFYRVPCVTLREETEWVELLESGWNTLCAPVSKMAILKTIMNSIGNQGKQVDLYGNGDTANRIVDILTDFLE